MVALLSNVFIGNIETGITDEKNEYKTADEFFNEVPSTPEIDVVLE